MSISNIKIISTENISKVEFIDYDTINIVINLNSSINCTFNNSVKNTIYKGYKDDSIYSGIGCSYKLGKELYEYSKELWDKIFKTDEVNKKLLDFFKNMSSIIMEEQNNSAYIIDISELDVDKCNEKLEYIKDNFRETKPKIYNMSYSNGLHLYLELNFEKSIYSIYNLKYIFATTVGSIALYTPTFGITPVYRTYSFSELLDFNFEEEINILRSLINSDTYRDTAYKLNSNIKLSLREVLYPIKCAKIKPELDDDSGMILSMGDSKYNSKTVINYLNSFNLPYKTLVKLSFMRKGMKYSELDCVEYVRFLEDIYFSSNNEFLTMDALNYIFGIIEDNDTDSKCIEEELNIKIGE